MRRQRLQIVLSVCTLLACLAGVDATLTAVAAESPLLADAKVLRRGKILWLQCTACHDLASPSPGMKDDATIGKIGPTLHGVIGRSAATVEGYRYSDALRNAGLTWDKPTLDRWIKEPAAAVPGTLMAFIGVPDEADRRALIAYLESATR